jgi:hypothetical protein
MPKHKAASIHRRLVLAALDMLERLLAAIPARVYICVKEQMGTA